MRRARRPRPKAKTVNYAGGPLSVEGIVPGGRGLARDAEGVIFIDGAFPGDVVTVKDVFKKGGVRHAVVDEIVTASVDRQESDCAVSDRCGGCDFLSLKSMAANAHRSSMVHDGLGRIGRLTPSEQDCIRPIVTAGDVVEKRRRVSMVVDADGRLSFHARRSHALVPVRGCPAADDHINVVIARAHDAPRARLDAGTRVLLACDEHAHVSVSLSGASSDRLREMANTFVHDLGATGVVLLDDEDELAATVGDPTLHGVVGNDGIHTSLQSDAATFSQATSFGGEAIIRAVVDGAGDMLSDPDCVVLELFAGAGHLTFPLAAKGASVLAVEGAPHGVTWLVKNLEQVSHDRVRAVIGHIDGESFLRDYYELMQHPPDLVVVDPPRTGILNFEKFLQHLSPVRLVMVSCDIATGARDIGIAKRMGYQVSSVVPIDAFPRTSHVEWVATLDRIDASEANDDDGDVDGDVDGDGDDNDDDDNESRE